MGNVNEKSEEDKKLDSKFISLSKNSHTIKYDELKKSWASQLDPYLYSLIEKYLIRESPQGVKKDLFKGFFQQLNRSANDDKAKHFVKVIGGSNVITENELLQFIRSVLSSAFIIQQIHSVKSFKSWMNRVSIKNNDSLELYARYFLNSIQEDKRVQFNYEDMKNLLVPFEIFTSMIFSSLYGMEEDEYFASLLPRWKYEPMESGRKLEEISILDPVKVAFINFELPVDLQNEWRLMFSSAINGESFSRLCSQVMKKGPTVVIVREDSGYEFGGFASQSWAIGPSFFGDINSFLFTLLPEMKVFPSTGFNPNFQYLNNGQQTMPNGLGMGGQLGYFGLWLSADFGKGSCSDSCTTFRNYKMMSSKRDFELVHVEVWQVGPPLASITDYGERSILDRNAEARNFLELAGKSGYSDGLREAPDDDDD